MYESRDFSAMPILTDALQDAGCDNSDVLDHCCGAGPHIRGCWVMDLVLGRSKLPTLILPLLVEALRAGFYAFAGRTSAPSTSA